MSLIFCLFFLTAGTTISTGTHMGDGAGVDRSAGEVSIKTGQFSQKYSLVQISSEKSRSLGYARGPPPFLVL